MERMDCTLVVEALNLSELKAVDPITKSEPGPFKFCSFNAYFDLPEAVRPAFVWGLKNMIKNFNLTEVNLARVMGREIDDWVRDIAYGEIANDFGELFDKDFRGKFEDGGGGIDDRVWELRRIFYRMINVQTALQVREAVRTIEELEWIGDWSEMTRTIKVRTGARG